MYITGFWKFIDEAEGESPWSDVMALSYCTQLGYTPDNATFYQQTVCKSAVVVVGGVVVMGRVMVVVVHVVVG
jgi:hypothetical protein